MTCGAYAPGDTYGAATSIVAKLGGGDDTYKYATYDGPQTVDGEGGNDTIETSNGKDVITGGAGDDDLNGGRGDDVLDGGDGNDTVDGWDGSDTVRGGAGTDRLLGDGGTLYSGGNDVIDARDGENDSVDCGGGADRATVDATDVVANCALVDRPATPATPTPATGPGPTPTPAPIADLSVVGKITTRQTPKALSQGKKVAVTLTANAACSGKIAIALSKGEAKRLKLGTKAISIGTSAQTKLSAGKATKTTVAVASKHRSNLARTSSFKATILIVCTDAAARTFTGGAAITFKR